MEVFCPGQSHGHLLTFLIGSFYSANDSKGTGVASTRPDPLLSLHCLDVLWTYEGLSL